MQRFIRLLLKISHTDCMFLEEASLWHSRQKKGALKEQGNIDHENEISCYSDGVRCRK